MLENIRKFREIRKKIWEMLEKDLHKIGLSGFKLRKAIPTIFDEICLHFPIFTFS